MKTLLLLQDLDLKIERCKARESEIPKQKKKYDIRRERLRAELAQCEQVCEDLLLEQRESESAIEQHQEQVGKYNGQLNAIRKNEEYQALLHEIDALRKQINLKEERILAIMEELETAQARLEEDRKRIERELKDIDAECAEIDAELADAVKDREALQAQGTPLLAQIDKALVSMYHRIRANKKTGAAAVPLNNEVCGGCHMYLRPQIVNEVMAGETIHTCQHCGRLLYHRDNFEDSPEGIGAQEP